MRTRRKKMAAGLPAAPRQKPWETPGFWMAACAAGFVVYLAARLRGRNGA